MRIPPSFALAYLPHEKLGNELQRYAGGQLRTNVSGPRNWLFDDRVKEPASALVKMECGSARSLDDLHDLYGATVVVPTRNEIERAVDAVLSNFPEARIKERDTSEVSKFVYDDVHVIARLGSTAPGIPSAIVDREFEVQIKTGLQFAWWRATHDTVYKATKSSWRINRIASQTRASLELLDAVLADLQTAANLLTEVEPADADFDAIAEWLERWPQMDRPTNAIRFVSNVDLVRLAAGLSVADLDEILSEDSNRTLVDDVAVTPFQAVLAAITTHSGADFQNRLPPSTHLLITDELIRAAPATDAVTAERRCRLA